MKENKDNKLNELKNKKGFMIAIYSCAAIVIAMTGIIASTKDKQAKNNENQTQIQIEQVNQSDVKSYKNNTTTGSSAVDTGDNSLTAKNTEEKEEKKAETDKTSKKEEKTSETKPTANAVNAEKSYTLFDDSQEMSWPLNGQIVMDYSMETAIYDKTLDQYRTNDCVCIAGKVGDEIHASAEGKVKSVSKDKENLTSVTIEHGNGWLSTYSQLQDDVPVITGDIVQKGAVIGNLSEPSYKNTLLGPHLEFKVTHNDNDTDPKILLAQEE